MAMKHEAPNDLRIRERNDELGLARFPIPRRRNAEGVAKTVEIRGRTVYFCNQESDLMNMKVVILGILVEDCPLFDVAELHRYVGAVLIKDLVVYKERCLLRVH